MISFAILVFSKGFPKQIQTFFQNALFWWDFRLLYLCLIYPKNLGDIKKFLFINTPLHSKCTLFQSLNKSYPVQQFLTSGKKYWDESEAKEVLDLFNKNDWISHQIIFFLRTAHGKILGYSFNLWSQFFWHLNKIGKNFMLLTTVDIFF